MYGPSCPLRAELSTGRVVHGPSCPGIRGHMFYKHALSSFIMILVVFIFSIFSV